jgi:hypothetical protein
MMRERTPVFTHRDLRNALDCPRKLYYKSHRYPTRYSAGGGLSHGRLLKGLLLAVARCAADETPVDEMEDQFLGEISLQDFQQLPDNQWYYNVAILAGSYRLAMPIIHKQEGFWSLYQVPTKTVSSPEHSFADTRPASSDKWERYWSDMALFTQVMREQDPELKLDCRLFVGTKGIRSKSVNPFDHIQLRPIPFPDHTRDILFLNEELRDTLREEQWMTEIDCDAIVERWIGLTFQNRTQFQEQLETWKRIKLKGTETPPVLGTHCRYCAFRLPDSEAAHEEKNGFDECWSREGESSEKYEYKNHILELPGHGVTEFLARDYRWQSEVPVEHEQVDWLAWLSKRSRFTMEQRQKLSLWDAHDLEVPQVMVRSGLWKEMGKWAFPWHCIDFEAAHLPIPLNTQWPAYERLLFQYSCHTIHQDGRISHFEWLQTAPGTYPNFQMVEALTAIPDIEKGTLFQYSPFEHQALRHISNQLAHLSDDDPWLLETPREELRERVSSILKDQQNGKTRWVDLHRMVNRFYFNRHSKASLSLKGLVTAVLNSDENLTDDLRKSYLGSHLKGPAFISFDEQDRVINPYQTLVAKEFDVSEGSEALAAYMAMQIPNLEEERRAEIRASLLQYGELDTLALVILLRHWLGIRQKQDTPSNWISSS